MAKNNTAPSSSQASSKSKSLIPVMILVGGILVALTCLLRPGAEKKEIITCHKKASPAKKKSKETPLQSCYNEPFMPHKKTSVFASGSYIYWQPSQQNFFVGQVMSEALPTTGTIRDAHFQRKTKNFKPKYESGFKVAFGAQFPEDNWSLYAEYVRLHSKTHTQASPTPPNFAQSAWIPVNDNDLSTGTLLNSMMSNSWSFHFDLLDLNLLRACYVGKSLVVSPFITGRGAWIRQSLTAKVSYATSLASLSNQAEFTQHSLQVGPRIGTDIHWLLGQGFRFSGKVGAALLYNRNHSHQTVPFVRTNSSTSPNITDNYSTKQGSFCPNLDLGIGFGWESRKHFGISASYDILTFFNQNNLGANQVVGEIGNFGTINNSPFGLQSQNNLTMHGLTVTMSYAF